MIGVYKITNPIGQVYVGSSKNIEKRWKGHKTLLKKDQRKLIESFEKYGVENHKFEVVIECKEDQLKEIETFYGLKLNALDREKGLNLMLPKLNDGSGGCSEDRITWNKGKKGLQEAWNKGIPLTTETKEKLSASLKGREAWNKGKKWSEESKRKMSESSKGSIAWNKRIVMDTQTGIFYESITEASKIFGIRRTTLQSMLDGINKNKTSLIIV